MVAVPIAWTVLFMGIAAAYGGLGRLGGLPARTLIIFGVMFFAPPLTWAVLKRRTAQREGTLYHQNQFRRWWATRGVIVGCVALVLGAIAFVGPLFSPALARIVGAVNDSFGLAAYFPMFFLAPLLLDAGARGYQRGTTPHCGACGYPCPTTRHGALCPECGRGVWRWTVMKGELVRSPKAVVIGGILFASFFVVQMLPLTGAAAVLLRAASTASLVQMLGEKNRVSRSDDVWAEIERRKGMSNANRDAVATKTMDILTDPTRQWRLGPGPAGWLVEQIVGGTLGDATLTRAVRFVLPLTSTNAGMAYGLADDVLSAELQPREARAVFERMMEALRSNSIALWQAGERSWLAAQLTSPDLSEQDEAALVAAAAATGPGTRMSVDVTIESVLAQSRSAVTAERAVRMWTAAHHERLARDFGGAGPTLGEALCAAVLVGTAPLKLEDAVFADEVALGELMRCLGPDRDVADRIAARLTAVLSEWLARGWRVWAADRQAWAWLAARRQAGKLDEAVGEAMDRAIEADKLRQRAPGANPGKG